MKDFSPDIVHLQSAAISLVNAPRSSKAQRSPPLAILKDGEARRNSARRQEGVPSGREPTMAEGQPA
jgi:hypothetical protein